MTRQILSFLLILLSIIPLSGQRYQPDYSAGAVLQQLEKLNTLGSVMYIAAHPDDENTRLIAYMANGAHYRTAYLSATRGDGGQNLIGPEIRESLGIIRTQELMAARSIDGGEQFFSRANDFGYSKHADETFTVWGRDQVLADFVWAIRKFRPDVLITRFSLEPGVTHGHHTASAVLAKEAFEISGDPETYPEQLEYVEPWQPARLFWNTSTWFFRRSGKTFEPDNYLKLDVGQYNTNLGQSYTEISALSRSMHKSQGFGDAGERGAEFEYFEQWGGDESTGLFEGIDTSWGRVEGTEQVAYFLTEARQNFDPSNPTGILPELLNARKELLKVSDQYWKEVKLKELEELVLMLTGTYLELTSDAPYYVPGDSIALNLEVINRSGYELSLSSVNFSNYNDQFIYQLKLKENQRNEFTYNFQLPEELPFTHPYWLEEQGTGGMYRVDNQQLIGLPQNPPALSARVTLIADEQYLDVELPVIYKTTDPVRGEVKRPVEIVPSIMVDLDSKAMVFAGDQPKNIDVRVIAGTKNISGELSLEVPDGWFVAPESYPVALDVANEEQTFQFKLTPPKKPAVAHIRAVVHSGSNTYARGRKIIQYDHIPTQTIFPKSEVKVVKIAEANISGTIGYIMGAGDEVPFSLNQIGFSVDILQKEDITRDQLARYEAVIVGIRAFNTLPWLAYKNQELFDYVKSGGNVIVQYNTSHRLVTEEVSPYELKLSRDRVTVEGAKVSFLTPGHPVLNKPYQLSAADFDGWVQERGLYFPNEWSKEFTPVFGMNDPGEEETKGSLLVARYGKGYYCYTGLSFFRELPAGVPGAYKLLVNMIALGDREKP